MRAEPDAMTQHERRQKLDVFGKHFLAPALEQRPHFREAAPTDDRARRSAEIDAAFDQLRWRMLVGVGIGVMRPSRGDETLNVAAEPLMQKDVLTDHRTKLDDPLLRQQRV